MKTVTSNSQLHLITKPWSGVQPTAPEQLPGRINVQYTVPRATALYTVCSTVCMYSPRLFFFLTSCKTLLSTTVYRHHISPSPRAPATRVHWYKCQVWTFVFNHQNLYHLLPYCTVLVKFGLAMQRALVNSWYNCCTTYTYTALLMVLLAHTVYILHCCTLYSTVTVVHI